MAAGRIIGPKGAPKDEQIKSRVAAGHGKWSSTIDDELGFIVNDFRAASFGDDVIRQVLHQNYRMLDKLGVKYNRPEGF